MNDSLLDRALRDRREAIERAERAEAALASSIDAAWAEAEAAANPEALLRVGRTGMSRTGWATCYLHGDHVATQFGETPAAALRALAAELRESKP